MTRFHHRGVSQSLACFAVRAELSVLRGWDGKIKAALCASSVVVGHRSLAGLGRSGRRSAAQAGDVRSGPALCRVSQPPDSAEAVALCR